MSPSPYALTNLTLEISSLIKSIYKDVNSFTKLLK